MPAGGGLVFQEVQFSEIAVNRQAFGPTPRLSNFFEAQSLPRDDRYNAGILFTGVLAHLSVEYAVGHVPNAY